MASEHVFNATSLGIASFNPDYKHEETRTKSNAMAPP